jgi:aspartate/methionine/tyrosine aminotransferase
MGGKDFTTICAPATAEFPGALALRHSEVLLDGNWGRLVRNREVLGDFMDRDAHRLACEEPGAGSVRFPRVREGSAEALCEAVRKEAGVPPAPGTLFDAPDEVFRIGYGREGFIDGLVAFDQWLGARGSSSLVQR